MTIVNHATITAVAGWVPEDVLTNADLQEIVDTNDEWIVSRTGIKERRILKEEGLGTSYMAAKAVEDLLVKSDTKAEDIDAIICATATPDMSFIATANIVCDLVGATNALSFDLSAACSGFVYALSTGGSFIKSGQCKKVVVIGADKNSAFMDYQDRTSCILFGDGAAAALLEGTEGPYFIHDSILKTDGTGKEALRVKAGGSAYPMNEERVKQREHFFKQDGRTVFKNAVTRMAEVAEEMLQKHGLTGDDIDWVIPHQANLRIIEATAKRIGVPMEKVAVNIHRYGNTTGATIPLCLWEWEGKFKKGDKILLVAFGGGFTWGATYLTWSK